MSKFKVIKDIKVMNTNIFSVGDEITFIDNKVSTQTKFGTISLSKLDILDSIKEINELNFNYVNGTKKYRMQLDINCTEDQLNEIEKEISKIIHKII